MAISRIRATWTRSGSARGIVAAVVIATCVAGAAPAPSPAPSLAAYENAYATSFYGFDACGDQIAGRIFRKAIADKLAACAFPAEARAHFQQWSAAQRRKSSDAIAQLVDRTGGLPVQLDGMQMTCREQRASPVYLAARDRLEHYARGEISVDAVITQSCDAPEIAP